MAIWSTVCNNVGVRGGRGNKNCRHHLWQKDVSPLQHAVTFPFLFYGYASKDIDRSSKIYCLTGWINVIHDKEFLARYKINTGLIKSGLINLESSLKVVWKSFLSIITFKIPIGPNLKSKSLLVVRSNTWLIYLPMNYQHVHFLLQMCKFISRISL